MEESNLINNDNIYNTDMSTSQSTIGGNATTNNKFNKNDLQEVTGGGGGGIVTQSTTIVYGTETSQTTGNLAPILLILGDGTITPDVEEEPVLLEEDEDITYNAVINSEYKDRVPTIKLDGSEVSYCDANYVIAVTETDETIPVIYDSQNLSKTFTNNGDNWCRVTFKKPLEVKDQLKLPLNSDNFLDNSKIIVPVISCEENNTGQERNTTITFNIKNFAISHNIQLNVIQESLAQQLVPGPCVLKYVSGYVQGEDDQTKYKILSNNTYYIFKNRGSSYIYENENDPEKVDNFKFYLLFGIVDDTNNIYDNLQATDNTELKDNYANSITSSKTNYKLTLLYETQVFRRRTAAIMHINIPDDAELQDVITFSYNNKQFMTLKYAHQDQKNTIIARAKWDGQTISIIHHLYFLTAKNPNKEIDYETHVLNAPMSLDNIIFLIDNKYQINTDKKILRNVLTQYNLEYEHDSGYDFNSYMDYYVMDISDCINDVYRNYVYLKDIEDGDPFANFKIYIYTRNNQSEYVYLGYIATVEPYNDAYETFIGFFDKNNNL